MGRPQVPPKFALVKYKTGKQIEVRPVSKILVVKRFPKESGRKKVYEEFKPTSDKDFTNSSRYAYAAITDLDSEDGKEHRWFCHIGALGGKCSTLCLVTWATNL
jgi:hypothetical protein